MKLYHDFTARERSAIALQRLLWSPRALAEMHNTDARTIAAICRHHRTPVGSAA